MAITGLEAFLRPVDPQRLLLAVAGLLEHWFVADSDDAVAAVVARDWVNALRRFPEWAIADARRDWLEQHASRPAPADIVAACDALVAAAEIELACLRLLADPEEQRQAWQRREEARRADEQRERERAEVRALLEADPTWSPLAEARARAGLVVGENAPTREARPARPLGEILASVPGLPEADDPGVQRWLRKMGS